MVTKESSSWRMIAVTAGSEATKQICQKSVGIVLTVETWSSASSNLPISVSVILCFLNIAARTLVNCATSGSRSY